jgi:valyl-tRNA synthetase
MPAEDKARASNAVQAVYDAVRNVRVLRAEFKVPTNQECVAWLARDPAFRELDLSVFRSLAKASRVEESAASVPDRKMPHTPTPLGEVYLELEIDVAAERKRLESEMAKVDAEIAKVHAKLSDESFVQGAPVQVLETFRQRGADWQTKRAKLEAVLNSL